LYFETNDKTKYHKYKEILSLFISNIQQKISKGIKKNNLPLLCPLETIILLHMIKLYKNGKHSDITIMDVYSIIYYFDECNDSIDEIHSQTYKCCCKSNFIENNKNIDNYQDIRKSIINHYIQTEKVNKLYNNYKNIISKLDDNVKLKYNILHPVVLGNNHTNFKFTNYFELIANSDNYIIDFIITPQFNKLNFNDIMMKAFFNNYLLQNTCDKHNNYERFNNKIIYTCILSLDSIEPIFHNFNIDKNCEIIKKTINNYLLNEYSEKHKIIYDFYQYCKIISPDKNSVKFTYEKIIEERTTRKNKKIVDYLNILKIIFMIL
jgi:hypothetical protein